MPKVQHVKAGKDYPSFGIKKGEMHYVWAIKMQTGGQVFRSLKAPRQSQLTMSDYKSQAHRLNEAIEDLQASSMEDLESSVADLVSEAEALRDEQQEKLDNMPEGLQQGSTGELIQSRIEALDDFISELEGIEFDLFEQDGEEVNEEGEALNHEDQTEQDLLDAKLEEIQAISLSVE